MAKVPWTYETLKARRATTSGVSDWFVIDQERINLFGQATADPDPMHIDPVWSTHSSPFGTTISFGFLTMSLLTHLLRDALGMPDDHADAPHSYPLNYGFDRLRLITPIPVGSRVRGRFRLLDVNERRPGQLVIKLDAQIEIDGQERPALVAEWLTVFVTDEASREDAQQIAQAGP